MTDPVQFELMRPPQIVEARRRCPVAYLPLGPLEWHGPHLPMGTDAIHAHRVSVEVARRVGGVVYPAYFLGTETVRAVDGPQSVRALGFEGHERIIGMDFPDNPVQSLYIEEGTFAVIIREIIRLITQDPYRLVVLVNGHGAVNHQRTLRRLAAEASTPRARVVYETAWGATVQPGLDPGHAERGETAFVMSAVPQSVDLSALPPIETPLRYRDFGIVNGAAFEGRPTPDFTVPQGSDPRYATSEEGAAALTRGIERLELQVRKYLADVTT
jgi:creatinine amidohydrolase